MATSVLLVRRFVVARNIGVTAANLESKDKGMRYTMQKSWYLVLVALALMLLATGPLAATVTFNLTGVGSGANLAGVYTSPYTGNINGGNSISVICDDFADDSYVPETWTAYQTAMSSLTSGTPDGLLKWLGAAGSTVTVDGHTLNQQQAYSVAAVLAVDILDAVTGSPAQEDLSFALWELFDYSAASAQLSGYNPDAANALNDLNGAVTYTFASANAAQVQADVNATTIYSYDTGATGNCPGTCTAPQEFLAVNMAEPSSPALLGFDLLAVAGLMLFVRRRLKLTQA
jgi:hypothetical protein